MVGYARMNYKRNPATAGIPPSVRYAGSEVLSATAEYPSTSSGVSKYFIVTQQNRLLSQQIYHSQFYFML